MVLAALDGHQGAAVRLQALGSGQLRVVGALGPVVELIARLINGRGAIDLVGVDVAVVAIAVAGGTGRTLEGAAGRALGVVIDHIGNMNLLDFKNRIEIEDRVGTRRGVEGELRHLESGCGTLVQRIDAVVGPADKLVAIVLDIGVGEQRGALASKQGRLRRGGTPPGGLLARRGVLEVSGGLSVGTHAMAVILLERVHQLARHSLPEGDEVVIGVRLPRHAFGSVRANCSAVIHGGVIGEAIVPVAARVGIAPAHKGPAVIAVRVAVILVARAGLGGSVVGDVAGRDGRAGRHKGGIDFRGIGQVGPRHGSKIAMQAMLVRDGIGVRIHGAESHIVRNRVRQRIGLADDLGLDTIHHRGTADQDIPTDELMGAPDGHGHRELGELRGVRRKGRADTVGFIGNRTAIVDIEATRGLDHAAVVDIGLVGRVAVDELHVLRDMDPGTDEIYVLACEGKLATIHLGGPVDSVRVGVAQVPAGEGPSAARGDRGVGHRDLLIGVVAVAVAEAAQRGSVGRLLPCRLRGHTIRGHVLVVEIIRIGQIVKLVLIGTRCVDDTSLRGFAQRGFEAEAWEIRRGQRGRGE